MEFIKYGSIENIENTRSLAVVFYHEDLLHKQWVAREKIHGTNFSFVTDGINVNCAKRSNFIGPTEQFFEYEQILSKYKNTVLNLFKLLGLQKGKQLSVFGEYAGQGIQKEINYGEKDFYVFDIIVDGQFLSELELEQACHKVGFYTTPLLGLGTFDELSNMTREFCSLVAPWKAFKDDLPSLETLEDLVEFEVNHDLVEKDNFAEGYVLKPFDPVFANNGKRVIFKCKTDKFKEKCKRSKVTPVLTLSSKDMEFIEDSTEYIAGPRLNNVLSHIGPVQTKDFGKVNGLFVQDILSDMKVDGFDINETENPSLIKRKLNSMCGDFIRKTWTDICL